MSRFYRYPSCVLNSGYSRNVIQDLFHSQYFFVPDLLLRVLQNQNGRSINDIKKKYKPVVHDIIDSYFSFLKEKDIVYFTNNKVLFKNLSSVFDFPATISNCIIILNNNTEIEIKNRIFSVESCGCEHLQLFIKNQNVDYHYIYYLLKLFNKSRISTIELVLSFNEKLSTIGELQNLFIDYPRLFKIVLFSAPATKILSVDNGFNKKFVSYIAEDMSYEDCGAVHPLLFKNNITFYTESQKYNTCLNRKLCLDAEGNIKNCPAMKQSFGNINDTALTKVVEKQEFSKLWFIHKDQIDVCKDCEFRHMCMDCRCFIKDLDNIYSQPAKCTYNPYICKWEGQEGYVSVENCGTYYKETGFVPNKRRIAKLNKLIWGDNNE